MVGDEADGRDEDPRDAPAGFVADHLEIPWDIDVEAGERAAIPGLEIDRIPSLNDDPAFIRALVDLVRPSIAR